MAVVVHTSHNVCSFFRCHTFQSAQLPLEGHAAEDVGPCVAPNAFNVEKQMAVLVDMPSHNVIEAYEATAWHPIVWRLCGCVSYLCWRCNLSVL